MSAPRKRKPKVRGLGSAANIVPDELRELMREFWKQAQAKDPDRVLFEQPENHWEIRIELANAGDTFSGQFLLAGIRWHLKEYGQLDEPLRSYAVKILGDVGGPFEKAKSPQEVISALRIRKGRGRQPGSEKWTGELYDWYRKAIREGNKPTVLDCYVGCDDKTVRNFLNGDLRRHCDLERELINRGILPDFPES